MPLVNSNPEEMREIFESVKTIVILGLSPDETKAAQDKKIITGQSVDLNFSLQMK